MKKESKKMAQAIIIDQIIDKGGLYGNIAELYKNDPIKLHSFILECSEQCWYQSLYHFWGGRLALAISDYTDRYHKFPLRGKH